MRLNFIFTIVGSESNKVLKINELQNEKNGRKGMVEARHSLYKIDPKFQKSLS